MDYPVSTHCGRWDGEIFILNCDVFKRPLSFFVTYLLGGGYDIAAISDIFARYNALIKYNLHINSLLFNHNNLIFELHFIFISPQNQRINN